MMKKNEIHRETDRQANYDLLRIICSIAVIMIHVSAICGTAQTNTEDPDRDLMVMTLIYNTLSRFAVPCFAMLSGSLLLSNEKNKNYKYFYGKTFKNIGIPTLIFSAFYFIYLIAIAVAKIVFQGDSLKLLIAPVKALVRGAPFPHMWYLYTLIGVYMTIPVLLRIKDSISEKSFHFFSCVYFIVSIVSGFTSSFKVNWSVSKVACYMGFILIGYHIKCLTSLKSNVKAGICILTATILLILLVFIRYKYAIDLIAEKYPLVGNFNPIIATASTLVFAGFSLLSIKTNKLENLSKKTFTIYLFHAGVLDVGNKIMHRFIDTKISPVYAIPFGIIIVFFISLVLSCFYDKIRRIINVKVKSHVFH